ncbi:hypothetical protein [Novosphingobium huizhouense]|uniref:hypothetical protein n=1 Tax=Novosphingobium huizhouense TaxID=2866625 RepID=UPI001CD8A5F8|nr:hypothetical protein [Novosphingobium huizhouense]
MNRPVSVSWFERLFLAAQALRLANVAVFMGALAAFSQAAPPTIMTGAFANAAVSTGLALVVSRGRMGLARWFVVALAALDLIGIAGIPALAKAISPVFALLSLAALSIEAAALVFLFRRETGEWLAQR